MEMFPNTQRLGISPAMLTWNSAEWYTPAAYIDAVKEVLGDIDVDPASCERANETVKSKVYYTKDDNGFTKQWPGKVFCNPPYGYDEKNNQSKWSARLDEQYQAGITTEAILLVNAAVGTSWYDRMCKYPVCQPRRRINFYSPSPKKHGATHGSAFFYLGPIVETFARVFEQFGRVMVSMQVSQVEVLTLWNVSA